MEPQLRNRPLFFSVPICALIAIASIGGLFFKGTYSGETAYLIPQALAQDVIDLVLIVPTILIAAIAITKGSRHAFFIWLGAMLYVVYTFVIYSFGIHFNDLFLDYCFTLGLSFYAIVTVLVGRDGSTIKGWFDEDKSNNIVLAYLWIIALLFFSQWLREIIPAMVTNGVPQSVKDAGTFTSAVHVLDLSIFLPGMAISAVFMRKKMPLGYIFAPSFVVFALLTGVALVAMVISMKASGIQVSLASLLVFLAIVVISFLVLLETMSHIKRLSKAAAR